MRLRPVQRRSILLPLLMLLAVPHVVNSQQDKVAALKQSLAANQKLQREYKWVETTVISLKGEEKSRVQKQCFYGPDGKIQKQQLTAPPQQAAPGGVKGKVAAKKKEEITAAMNQAVALIRSYVPPDSQRIQAARAAGNLAVVPVGPNSARVDIRNYLKSGDSLSLGLDTAGNALQTVSVKSYVDSEKNAVTLDVTFAKLRGGLSYPGNIALNVPEQKMLVVIQNSNYERLTPPATAAAKPPAAKPPAGAPAAPTGASTAAIDALTAPIALYPDALVTQILPASTDFAAVQKFAGWMGSNASLKGSAVQDGAQQAGFAPCYVALAPFPQVVKMLVEKPDWTKGLGQAFTTDRTAVFDSIQRLRVAAQALGNLKTTEQQEVVAQTTSSGQQVIVIQPANPQVIYVPVYTQTVYVQPAPPPSSANVAGAVMVGFAAGVIIGSSHNHYYYGRAGAYNEAWDRREDYYEDRQDYREDRYEDRDDYANNRQNNAQANQSQRQSTSQSNQANRQSTSQSNQSNRQSTAQTSQDARQTTASSGTGGSGQTAQANQANRQSTAQSSQSARQSTAQSSQSSRQSASYQNGGAARAQSARGSSSRGGGRRR